MRTEQGGQASITVEPGQVVVRLEGEIDLETAPCVLSCTDQALAVPGNGGIVIDLTDCTFMDSSGLKALVAATRAADQQGRPMRISGAHGIVLRVMQLTDLDATLPLDP
jgi:anti-anti-sigma factor